MVLIDPGCDVGGLEMTISDQKKGSFPLTAIATQIWLANLCAHMGTSLTAHSLLTWPVTGFTWAGFTYLLKNRETESNMKALKRPKLSAQPTFLEGLFLRNIIIICKTAKFKENSEVGFKMSQIFGTTAFLGFYFLRISLCLWNTRSRL